MKTKEEIKKKVQAFQKMRDALKDVAKRVKEEKDKAPQKI